MAMKAIAYSYWRSIKRGTRTFESIPDNIKDDVKTVAHEDVINGVITIEEYIKIIGEIYK